jgi:hypothetical protein
MSKNCPMNEFRQVFMKQYKIKQRHFKLTGFSIFSPKLERFWYFLTVVYFYIICLNNDEINKNRLIIIIIQVFRVKELNDLLKPYYCPGFPFYFKN